MTAPVSNIPRLYGIWKVSEGLATSAPDSDATRFHNHGPSEQAAIHASNRRPTKMAKQEILKLEGMIILSTAMGPKHHSAYTDWNG